MIFHDFPNATHIVSYRFHSKAILQTLAESPGGSMQALTAGAPPGGDAGDIS